MNYNLKLLDTLTECLELLGYENVDNSDVRSVVEQMYAVTEGDAMFEIDLWEGVTIDGVYNVDPCRTWSSRNLRLIFDELVTFLEEAYDVFTDVEFNVNGHNVAWIADGGRMWSISAERDDVYVMFFELFISFMRNRNAA